MAANAKQSLASDYARMLVITDEARKKGLENSEHYKDLVSFLKLQLLAQELFRSFQEQAKASPRRSREELRRQRIQVRRAFIEAFIHSSQPARPGSMPGETR